jgi:hypothetical protein
MNWFVVRRTSRNHAKSSTLLPVLLILSILFGACQAQGPGLPPENEQAQQPQPTPTATLEPVPTFVPRPLYKPGELVDYVAQTGDTLPNLALRFNTTIAEILEANTFIPETASTMPPGMPMKIPIYYMPLWGSPYKILPDSLFPNGPAQIGFNTSEFVSRFPGWLNAVVGYTTEGTQNGAELVDIIAKNYSVSPRLLLALLEYHSGALTNPDPDPSVLDFPLGYRDWSHKGLYMQLGWGANLLNNGFYAFRTSRLNSIELSDGRLERFDPWINAATASLHNYFNQLLPIEEYHRAISSEGFAKTYQELFGDTWENEQPHIPGSLAQPEFILPFELDLVWAYTGGPHTGWGKGEPYSALDFAPPSVEGGCVETGEWATAVAPGVVSRSEFGVVVLDLDGDGDERTGWNVFYLHVATEGRAPLGATLERGDPVGHPSCEGGSSTGTHVHIARKYNGEWMPADGLSGGILAFNMEGWIAQGTGEAYQGSLVRYMQTITACVCSNRTSFIHSERR